MCQHPRSATHRFERLTDEQIASFRAAHPQGYEAARCESERLLAALELRRPLLEEAGRAALREGIRHRDVLGVHVCLVCGANALGFTRRRWDIDRAMRRTGLPEAALDSVAFVLAEAWAEVSGAPPPLDDLDAAQIEQLHAMAGSRIDGAAIRARLGGARS